MQVTSTMAKAIDCRRKPDFTPLIRRKLEPALAFPAKAMAYGVKNESKARAAYVQERRKSDATVQCGEAGFCIAAKSPWLGASPDGIVTEKDGTGLLEIKCPYVARNAVNAADYTSSKSSCLSKTLLLKSSYAYYYQVQVAMHACEKEWCDFCVWAPKFLVIHRVKRDDTFLKEVVPKLEK